jgi:outer membrane receptor protein involved in Fe transport
VSGDSILGPAGPPIAGNGETTVLAPYAMYQGKFTSWFQLLAGARIDRIDFEDTNPTSPQKFTETDVSPTLGVVFQPSEKVSIYASANESFAPPSVRVDDPRPEEGRQLELGVKQSYQEGKVLVNLAVYQLERENIPIPDANGFTQQAGDQESKGFEVDVAAEPLPGLRTLFSYSYTDAELTSFSQSVFDPNTFMFVTEDRSGNTPAFVPEHMASVWVTQRYNSGFGWGVGARYVGEQFIAEDNAFAIDSYTLADVALYYRIGKWDLQINVKNATDERFETRGFGSTSVLPGDGRAVYGGFEVQF